MASRRTKNNRNSEKSCEDGWIDLTRNDKEFENLSKSEKMEVCKKQEAELRKWKEEKLKKCHRIFVKIDFFFRNPLPPAAVVVRVDGMQKEDLFSVFSEFKIIHITTVIGSNWILTFENEDVLEKVLNTTFSFKGTELHLEGCFYC